MTTTRLTDCTAHARGLRKDIQASPTIWLPRRDIFLLWLNGFLTRAESSKYELGEFEATDLIALDHFLRKKGIPVAA